MGSQVLVKFFQFNNIVYVLIGEYFQVEVYDFDMVLVVNIGCQVFYFFDIGKNKVEVLVNCFVVFFNQLWEVYFEQFVF